MDLTKIDKNFDVSFEAPEDLVWYSARQLPFGTYGVYYEENEGQYRRMPHNVARNVSDGVTSLSRDTAGGRIRFATDSPCVAIRAKELFKRVFPHMTVAGRSGYTLFEGDTYLGSYMPSSEGIAKAYGNEYYEYDGIVNRAERHGALGLGEFTLFMPLYNPVQELFIGLKKGCTLQAGKPYQNDKPVLFYGSSITQGGCANKPSDDYVNRLSRRLNIDVLNLGFSGSAKAEPAMIDYLCSLDPSVFVLDYDHNAPTVEHLAATHEKLFKAFRKAHPETPVIMMTMPEFAERKALERKKARFDIIKATYENALATGDKNVYFIDCYGVFDKDGGTVDGCHPDSLGFLRMANLVFPVLEKLI